MLDNSFYIADKKCVNSDWTASFLLPKRNKSCECSFECKIKITMRRNGHSARDYIVTAKEFRRLKKELTLTDKP